MKIAFPNGTLPSPAQARAVAAALELLSSERDALETPAAASPWKRAGRHPELDYDELRALPRSVS